MKKWYSENEINIIGLGIASFVMSKLADHIEKFKDEITIDQIINSLRDTIPEYNADIETLKILESLNIKVEP